MRENQIAIVTEFTSYSTSRRLELAALLELRGDRPADLEESLALRGAAATEVGGVAGEERSGIDVEAQLGRSVGGEVHC